MTTHNLTNNTPVAFQSRLDRLERAQSRVKTRLAVWSGREERFALIRLLVAVALVMLLVGFYKRMDAAQVTTGWLSFFVAFFVMSTIHQRLKRIRARCEGLASVFSAEISRLQRDWHKIRQIKRLLS